MWTNDDLKLIRSSALQNRFFAKIKKTKQCWIWTAGRCDYAPIQYGCFKVNHRMCRAHTVSWIMFNKKLPKLCILHTCDNSLCVNPKHLYEGTRKDNARDRERRHRGNHARGVDNGQVKLTEKDVRDIRRLANKHTQQYLSDIYGVNQPNISRIIRRAIWAHI